MNHLSTWLSVCFAAHCHLLEEPCPQASEQSSCLSSGNRQRVERSQEHPPPGIDRDNDGDRDDDDDRDDGDDGKDGDDGDDDNDGDHGDLNEQLLLNWNRAPRFWPWK